MAHPHSKDASASKNSKMRKMTAHYGAADPKMNKAAGVTEDFQEGPQEAQGFGVEGNAMPQRNDRASRRAMNANPIATLKRGGRVHEHSKAKKRASGGDVSTIEEANRNQAETNMNRAKGGRTNKKGATHVNVIIAQHPQSGNTPPAPPPGAGGPPGMPPMPPHPPMAGGPPGMPPGGGMPMPGMMPPPGGVPPGLMPRKRGGRVSQHEDAKEDAAQIRSLVKPSALKRARGGLVKVGLDEGSLTGEGRLVKSAVRAKRQAGDKSAQV